MIQVGAGETECPFIADQGNPGMATEFLLTLVALRLA